MINYASMKKILIIILTIYIALNINFLYAIDLSSKEKLFITRTSKTLEKLVNNDIKYKDKLIISLNRTLKKLKKNSKNYLIINEITTNLKKVSLKTHSNNHYKQNKINIEKVKTTWIWLHNTERNKLWLKNYKEDNRLNNTAYEWSTIMKNKSSMDHKRFSNSSFYNYNQIENWFQDRWVNCIIANWTTSTESIWKFAYYCSDKDCSDELITSLKSIFQLYMNEKWLTYPANAHYRAIVHNYINYIWLWISIKYTWDNRYEYYVATHYCTEFDK